MTRPLQILIGLLAISACQHVPPPDTSSATGEASTTADEATTGEATTGRTTDEASTGAAFEPLAGEWSLELGAELDRTCVGMQTPFFFPMSPHVLTNDGAGGFSLAYGAGEPAIHSCARKGVDFECPCTLTHALEGSRTGP